MERATVIELVRRNVQIGRQLLQRHRKQLTDLIEMGADPTVIAAMRNKIEISEEVHAEDVAELRRLTTN
jgi:hypothetical protein